MVIAMNRRIKRALRRRAIRRFIYGLLVALTVAAFIILLAAPFVTIIVRIHGTTWLYEKWAVTVTAVAALWLLIAIYILQREKNS